jgi:hypothetical protein
MDAASCIEKARQCFRLARECGDEKSAEELRRLGQRYADLAVEFGADPKRVPSAETS